MRVSKKSPFLCAYRGLGWGAPAEGSKTCMPFIWEVPEETLVGKGVGQGVEEADEGGPIGPVPYQGHQSQSTVGLWEKVENTPPAQGVSTTPHLLAAAPGDISLLALPACAKAKSASMARVPACVASRLGHVPVDAEGGGQAPQALAQCSLWEKKT